MPPHAPWHQFGPSVVAVAEAENALIVDRPDRALAIGRLSERARVSLRTITRIEKRPKVSCHVSTVQRLAAALSPDDPGALMSELTAGSGARRPQRPRVPPRPLPLPRPDQWWRQGKPFPISRKDNARYDAATARELLTITGEFPRTKNGMLILLTEYRHALYDLASAARDPA